MIKLHFVCRGNIYRSRLAEAYAKYLLRDRSDIKISSSGIEAVRSLIKGVNPITVDYLKADGLADYLSDKQQQTTQDMLDKPDTVVFMNDTVYADALERFDINKEKTRVWHIPDRTGVYPQIKQQVELLLNELSNGNTYE